MSRVNNTKGRSARHKPPSSLLRFNPKASRESGFESLFLSPVGAILRRPQLARRPVDGVALGRAGERDGAHSGEAAEARFMTGGGAVPS